MIPARMRLLLTYMTVQPDLLELMSRVDPHELADTYGLPIPAIIIDGLAKFFDDTGSPPPTMEALTGEIAELVDDYPELVDDEEAQRDLTQAVQAIFEGDRAELRANPELGRGLANEFVEFFHVKPQLERLARSDVTGDALRQQLDQLQGATSSGAVGSMVSAEPLDVDAILNELRATPDGLLTGWPALDSQGLRFHPQQLTIVAGLSGGLKTSLMLNLSLRWAAREDGTVVFACYETPAPLLVAKLIAIEIASASNGFPGMSVEEVVAYTRDPKSRESWPVHPKAVDAAIDAVRKLQDRLVLIYEPALNVSQLGPVLDRIAQRGPISAVMADYLQIIPPPDQEADRRDVAVGKVAETLKACAVKHRCPVLAACQLNREVFSGVSMPAGGSFTDTKVQEKLRKLRPQPHHLRDSDQIRHYADMILGVQNPVGDFISCLPADKQRAARQDDGPFLISTLKGRFQDLASAELKVHLRSGFIFDPAAVTAKNTSEGVPDLAAHFAKTREGVTSGRN